MDSDDFLSLFLNDIPLMDVRAPVEFRKGSFPTASNIPLLDDDQREKIGIRYKEKGEQAAIELGLELATADIRQNRLKSWIDFCGKNNQGYLYCFRGGLRSRTTQQWIREQGIDYPLVKGGYKAMRRFLIDELEKSLEQLPLVIVSGLTGCGKTHLLNQISRKIDFEGIANHRGSAFGRDPLDQQPSTIDWENHVSIDFLKLRYQRASQPVFVEDEGRRIGRVSIPDNLFAKMQVAPRAILTVDTESRLKLIADDYIVSSWPAYQNHYAENATKEFSAFVLHNLDRIQKRLGGERYKAVKACFESALCEFFDSGKVTAFYDGIQILLEQYYDPMYRYQLANKDVDILFEGPEDEYLEWAENYLLNSNSLQGSYRPVLRY
ncbi:MAG: tRNA 2-selenouridine(34) synthase MnmH [Gammaproteobacteria bacterium]|nr:tRNA 2-selenouridine(34) synthase MnmH [Gammaproteobacteria bacterium]